jgi:predicted small lipoprotein YifL
MKKNIALILAFVMVACVFSSCGKKGELEWKPITNADDEQNSEYTSSDVAQSFEDEIPTINKQEMYEDVFVRDKYTFASKSFVMDTAGLMKTTCLADSNNAAFIEIAGVVEDAEMGMALLVKDMNNIYFHMYGVEEGEAIDQWFKCTDTDAAEGDTTVENMATTDEFTSVMSQVNKVEFVETIGGLDKVIIYCPVVKEEFEMSDDLIVDMTIEVKYNGTKGEYRYEEYASGSSGYSSMNTIEGFSFNDYEFDAENLTLTKGDEVIQCTLVTDHLAGEAESSNEVKIEVMIEADSCAIRSMTMTDETGAVSTIDFIECLDVMEKIEIPGVMEEIAYEDAVMQLVAFVFAIAFSGAGA